VSVFSQAEYERRIEATEGRMRERGIDALYVTDPANMNYLTGYDGWSFYVHQGVVVTLAGDQPTWIGRGMDANGARATVWMDDDHVRSYGDDHVHSPADRHPADYAAGVIAELSPAGATVGVEMDAAYYTARCHRRLSDRLPDASLVDATLLVGWTRLVKSEAERDLMREAARLSEAAMAAAVETIAPGVRESRVAAEIYAALIGGTEEHGGDYPAITPLMPSGDHTGTPHLTWSDREFEAGDPVIVELAGCRHRYHAPLARTAVVGEAPAEMRRVADVVTDGLAAALDAAGPGVTCEAVERAWRETIAAHGIRKESRLGYAMGLGYPPDWGEHTASIRPGDETVLEPGMTFHVIPGIWTDEFGVEISESIAVTENGVETLAEFPRDLIELEP